ncbi:MAG: hypothetical protein FWD61_05160 [Phycisphaerales bacterium]|nr:hypothetical protein [Phycisphaerales bacterium]
MKTTTLHPLAPGSAGGSVGVNTGTETQSKNPRQSRGLTAFIVKEIRQNLIYVALIYGLATIVATFCLVNTQGDSINMLKNDNLLGAILFSCILGGLVLGIVQPIADLHFERWSFIMHRPAPRSLLFLGRVLAGFFLYILAIGLPLLALLVIAATPLGGIYFIWQFTLPAIAFFLLGFAWYFAGMLVSDRYALFYGSRVLPFALAILAFFIAALPTFSLAVLGMFVITALLAAASLGSFLTRGYSLTPPKPLRAVLIFTFLLCFTALLYPGFTARRASIQRLRSYLQFFPELPYATTRYTLSPDGSLAQVTTEVSRPNNNSQATRTSTYSDLAGNPLPTPADSDWHAIYHGWMRLDPQPAYNYSNLDLLVSEITPHRLFDNTRGLYILFQATYEPGIDNRPERVTLHREGTFGSTGFAPAGTSAQPFRDVVKRFTTDSIDFIATRQQLQRIDFKDRQATTLFTAPDTESIVELSTYSTNADDKKKAGVYIATAKNLYMVTLAGEIQKQFPLTHDPRQYALSIWYFPEQHRWAINYNDIRDFLGSQFWECYDNSGKLIESHEGPQFNVFPPPPPALSEQEIAINNSIDLRDGPLAAAANPLTGYVARFVLRHILNEPWYRQDQESLDHIFGPPTTWRGWLTCVLTLLLSAAITVPLARWYHRRPVLWAILSFLTGPAAILTLIATNTFPQRIACPSCKKRRIVSEESCPHCHAIWPTPPRTGTEIFAEP